MSGKLTNNLLDISEQLVEKRLGPIVIPLMLLRFAEPTA
jgi:hypothetical protein